MPVDQQTFVELTTRNQNRLYRFILALVPNHSQAEELHQQTILTLWEKWETYESDSPFLPWAFGIARNHVFNHRRKVVRRGVPVPLTEKVVNRIADYECQNFDVLDKRREALFDCVRELSKEQQQIINAYYAEGRSAMSIAESTGHTMESIYKTMQRLRRALFGCVNRKMALDL